MITSATGVVELGTILGIWAHPDDEAYLSGGLMAIARDHGSRVVCVTATRGELGTADPVGWPPHRLAAARSDEMARCLDILGVREHHWLDYPDGGCPDVDATAAVDALSRIIDRVHPDTVLTFGPDGLTGHPDHREVAGWVAAAVDLVGPGIRVLQAAVPRRGHDRWGALSQRLDVFEPGFPVVVPDDGLAVDLTLEPRILDRKVRALAAQRTQTAGLIETLGIGTYREWVGVESFVQRPAPITSRPGADRSTGGPFAAHGPG